MTPNAALNSPANLRVHGLPKPTMSGVRCRVQAIGIGARSARRQSGIDLLRVRQRGRIDVVNQVVAGGGDEEQRVVRAERSGYGRGNARRRASRERDVAEVPKVR